MGSILNAVVPSANAGMTIYPGALAASGSSPPDGLRDLGPDTGMPFWPKFCWFRSSNNIYSWETCTCDGGFWCFRLNEARYDDDDEVLDNCFDLRTSVRSARRRSRSRRKIS